jgi:tetratricopeptide (TPR) repeat protein
MDQAVASGFDRRPEQRTDPVDPDGAVVLERAREALEEALLLLRAGDARRGPALNDLLQLAVWEEDPEEAYARLEALERASLRGSERVRSLLLISELEARLGNADEAILPLKIAVRDYPWEAKAPDVYTRLYTFYKRQGDLDSALAVLEKWVLLVTEADEALPLLACFLPGDDSLVLDLATVPDRRSLFIRSDVLLQSLRRPQDPRWQVNDETVLFLRGYLAYAGESYREAERRFAHYLGVSRNRDFVEQALYYDMLCGLLTAKPAAVRAYRANRYLATCSENPRSREALLNLLQAYYEMGLYHATLSAAKAAFVNEVVRMGVSDREERREHWLRSVAQVAQCYNHLGFHDRANQLFRSFGSQLRLLRAPGSVYLDWARTAFELGQQREGIRRLRVAEDWVVDPETRLRMQVAREMHSLTHGVTDDPGPLLEKMDRIRSLAVSDPDTYRPLLRNLYEELLDYLSSKSPDRVAVVLHELLTDFPAETDGTEYWLLRYLTDRLDTMPADEVSQGMEQVLAVLDPDTTRAFECAQQGTAAVRGLARLQEQMREIEQRGLTHEQ